MTPDTIRRIDALPGVALCALLTLHRRLLDALRPRAAGATPPPRRLLFIVEEVAARVDRSLASRRGAPAAGAIGP